MIMITVHMLSNSIFLFLQSTSILEVYSVIAVCASFPANTQTLKYRLGYSHKGTIMP